MEIKKTFTISNEILEKCIAFANASAGSSSDKYAKRNQTNISKITEDIKNGKIAEEILYECLKQTYPDISAPDHNIYAKGDKSWASDFLDTDSGIKVGCKGQDIKSAINYGKSWIFQYRAGASYDCDTGIFGKQDDKHFVGFVSLNVPKRIADVEAIVKVSWLHQHKLFKEMKLPQLRSNKVAVYYDDLEEFKDQLWQI